MATDASVVGRSVGRFDINLDCRGGSHLLWGLGPLVKDVVRESVRGRRGETRRLPDCPSLAVGRDMGLDCGFAAAGRERHVVVIRSPVRSGVRSRNL